MGQQSAAQCHSLAFTTRELPGSSFQQAFQSQQMNQFLWQTGIRWGIGCSTLPAIEQVAPNGEVRKQAPILKYIADASLFGGHGKFSLAVVQASAVQLDDTAVGSEQASHELCKGGFAAARATEEGDHSRTLCAEIHIEAEFATLLGQTDVQHQFDPGRPRSRRRLWLASSARASPAMPMLNDNSASRAASGSPSTR